MTEMAKGGWWWPDVSSIEAARKATMAGVWGAVISGAITSLAAAWAVGSGKMAWGFINAGSFLDVAVFFALAFGIYKNKRWAAVTCLLLFVVEKVLQVQATGQFQGAPMAIILTLCFISSVRGTFAFHKLQNVELAS